MDFNLKKAGLGAGRGRKVCTHKLKVAPPRVRFCGLQHSWGMSSVTFLKQDSHLVPSILKSVTEQAPQPGWFPN